MYNKCRALKFSYLWASELYFELLLISLSIWAFCQFMARTLIMLDVSAAFVMLDCELHPDKVNLLLKQPLGFKI